MRTRAVKTWLLRLLWLLASLLALAAVGVWIFLRGSLATLDGKQAAAGLAASVTIARDDHGVPLISGSERYDVAYATGFVHGQERYFQMDLLRRVAAGELAELFGPKAIPLDKSHRLHRLRARAEESLKKLSADDRQFIDRYVAGVNAGLDALAARPFEYVLVGAKPAHWTAPDSLLAVWAMYFDLQGNQEARELARGWVATHTDAAQRAFLLPEASQWDVLLDGVPATAGAAPIPPTAPAWWGAPRSGPVQKIAAAEFTDSVGSNNWAIAGSRSADGRAIVANDMHLGLQLPHIWYRVALQFKDAAGKPRRLVGVTLPGAPPIIVVGSNGHMAWGFTNSYGDFLDLIEVGTDAARPGQVKTPAGWETPRAHEEVILVKGQAPERMQVRETSYGPLRDAGGRTVAVHWIAQLPESVNINHRRLENADTVAAALDVAATLGVPAQNFVAGDDQGNIGWTICGTMPRRAAPAIDASFPIAADNAALTWTGLLDPRDYPRIINPASGQISTANSRQLGGKGAEILGDGGFDLGARNHQIDGDLTALGAKADVKGAYAIGLDDRAVFLDSWRRRAIAALDAKAVEGHSQRADFLRLLQTGWTGHASVDSVGYRLTRNFMWTLQDMLYGAAGAQVAAIDEKATMHMASSRWPQIIARLLDEQPAGWLPAAYPSWQALQLAAIDRVISELATDGKPLSSATWGARNTAAIMHPIAKAVPMLKRWLSAPADMLPGDANMPRVAGPAFGQSERMTLSPGKEEEGIFNMPGGQSGHPLSPYFLRGHEDWVKGTPTRLLPGPAQHTLTLVPLR